MPLDSEIGPGEALFALRSTLNNEHDIKAGRPAGNTIWQGIYQTILRMIFPCFVRCR